MSSAAHDAPELVPGSAAPPQRRSGLAAASLVLAVAGLCLFPLALVAVVLGVIAFLRQRRDPTLGGRTLVIVAFALSSLSYVTSGVLAAIAIPSFVSYIRRAKTSEATTNLQGIFASMAEEHAATGAWPEPIPRTPAEPPCGAKAPWPSDADPRWAALGFRPAEPLYFAYELESDAAARVFTLRAVGDLDCDRVLSTFELAGSVDGAGELYRAPGFFIENELE